MHLQVSQRLLGLMYFVSLLQPHSLVYGDTQMESQTIAPLAHRLLSEGNTFNFNASRISLPPPRPRPQIKETPSNGAGSFE